LTAHADPKPLVLPLVAGQGQPGIMTSLHEALANKKTRRIVIDRCNPRRCERATYFRAARKAGCATALIFLDVDADTALERCRRTGSTATVPPARAAKAIARFFESLDRPIDAEADTLEVIAPALAASPALAALAAPAAAPSPSDAAENTSQGEARIIERIAEVIVHGSQPAAVAEIAEKLGISPGETAAAIAAARDQIKAAATIDPQFFLGAHLLSLQDIERRSIALQDNKTALAARSKLIDLTHSRLARTPPPTAGALTVSSPGPAPLTALTHDPEADLARAALRAAGVGSDDMPLGELVRLTVTRIVELSAVVNRQ
jgi:hypothetical protein